MRELVDPWVLTQALKLRTRTPRQRLVSLLISRAQLDPDDGAMALSTQLGHPAALQRHLERRDPACAHLIPGELIQRWCVLPLCRARDGRLVVVARDPTPILVAALEHASKQAIVLAVTPSIHLERAIPSIYGMAVDAEAAPAESILVEELAASIEISEDTPLRPGRTLSAEWFNDGVPELPTRKPQRTEGIEATVRDIENTITIAAAERMVCAYGSQRWKATLLLDVAEGVAVGRRGVGPQLTSVDTIALSLASPSTIQVAHDTAHATSLAPASASQQSLCHLLDDATMPAAAPIVVGGIVRSVLVVGDPWRGGIRESVAELARLADALCTVHARTTPAR